MSSHHDARLDEVVDRCERGQMNAGASTFVHVRRDGGWLNETMSFQRLPCVGETISLTAVGPLYRVVGVIHCPHDDKVGAELYLSRIPDSVQQDLASDCHA